MEGRYEYHCFHVFDDWSADLRAVKCACGASVTDEALTAAVPEMKQSLLAVAGLRARISQLEGLLGEAYEAMTRRCDPDAEFDLVCRIDFALKGADRGNEG